MSDWREIETAPFDDTIIMIWRKGDLEAYAGWWLGAGGKYEWAFVDETRGEGCESITPNSYFCDYGPTHWRPLPAPPIVDTPSD